MAPNRSRRLIRLATRGALVAALALPSRIAAAAETPPSHPAAHHPAHHGHEPVRHPAAPPHPARHPAQHPAQHPGQHPPQHPAHHAAPPPPKAAAKPAPAVAAVPAAPPLPPAAPKGTNTGLPLPRFAALRADAVNLRSGPGTRYPIQWVYKRRDLPVRIEREFDVWRLIEDSDGVKGWAQGATLVGTRTFVIPDAPASTPEASPDAAPAGSRMLRAAPQPDAAVVAILKPGVIGRLRACPAGSGWCRVSVRDYAGWLPRNAFWGLLPDETIQPP